MTACKTAASRRWVSLKVSKSWLVEAVASAVLVASVLGALAALLKWGA